MKGESEEGARAEAQLVAFLRIRKKRLLHWVSIGADLGSDRIVLFRSKSCLTLENAHANYRKGGLVRAVLFSGVGHKCENAVSKPPDR